MGRSMSAVHSVSHAQSMWTCVKTLLEQEQRAAMAGQGKRQAMTGHIMQPAHVLLAHTQYVCIPVVW